MSAVLNWSNTAVRRDPLSYALVNVRHAVEHLRESPVTFPAEEAMEKLRQEGYASLVTIDKNASHADEHIKAAHDLILCYLHMNGISVRDPYCECSYCMSDPNSERNRVRRAQEQRRELRAQQRREDGEREQQEVSRLVESGPVTSPVVGDQVPEVSGQVNLSSGTTEGFNFRYLFSDRDLERQYVNAIVRPVDPETFRAQLPDRDVVDSNPFVAVEEAAETSRTTTEELTSISTGAFNASSVEHWQELARVFRAFSEVPILTESGFNRVLTRLRDAYSSWRGQGDEIRNRNCACPACVRYLRENQVQLDNTFARQAFVGQALTWCVNNNRGFGVDISRPIDIPTHATGGTNRPPGGIRPPGRGAGRRRR